MDNCIAVAGADFGALIKSEVHLKSVTYILDNEPRSKEIVKKMETLINSGNELVIWPDTILEKDINDMVLAGKDVKEIIDNNTYSGLTATTQLSIWKRI